MTEQETSINHVNIHLDPEDQQVVHPSVLVKEGEVGKTWFPHKQFSKKQQLLQQHARLFSSLNLFYEKHYSHLHITFTVFLFLFDIYKILMGSFLLLFTYQNCDLMSEKLSCFERPYQLFALAWNVLTFVLCFVQLGFQIHREAYFIRELYIFRDNTNTIEQYYSKYENYSAHEYTLDDYGRNILEQVSYFNQHYALCVKMSTLCFLLNTILSGVSIYVYSYVNNKTITSFASNVLLLALLIAKGIYVVHKTISSETVVAFSTYNQEIEAYNGVNIFRREGLKRKINMKITQTFDDLREIKGKHTEEKL
jgi:hypothetical protein